MKKSKETLRQALTRLLAEADRDGRAVINKSAIRRIMFDTATDKVYDTSFLIP